MAGSRFVALLMALSFAGPALAGKADVVGVRTSRDGAGFWTFSVTVRHGDEGPDHYADRFEVVAPDGTVLATRVLAHPHETEQPFTRSLSGISIPQGISSVTVRARDSQHGYGGAERKVVVVP